MPPKKSAKPASKASKKPASTSNASKTAMNTGTPKIESESSKKRPRSLSPLPTSSSLTKLLQFLLNESSTAFVSPKPDQPNLFDHMPLSDDYTPFQNLVACVVMSKPISSRLGVRTLKTIFGDEIGYTTPKKMMEAGGDERYSALSKARTQHKDKTSIQLGRLAEKVISEYASNDEDTTLSKLREKLDGAPDNLAGIMKEFYGLGDTAADIFRRHMQKDWKELYPFADERTLNAAAHLGLAHEDSQALAEQVDEILPSKNEDDKRRQFTKVVDALVGVDLEHRYEECEEIMVGEKMQAKQDEPEEGVAEKPPSKVAKKND